MNNYDQRCPICHSKQTAILFEKDKYFLIRCKECGYGWVHPMPNAETLKSFYDSRYFNSSSPDKGYHLGYNESSPDRIADFNIIYRLISKYLDCPSSRPAILDVGCACGHFMQFMAGKGFQVAGIDVSEWAVRVAIEQFGFQDNQLYCGIIEEYLLSDKIQSFYAITMLDLLEHVPNPFVVLESAVNLMAPGGVLIAKVPNLGSLRVLVERKNWRQFKPPDHLHYFSKKSIYNLFARVGLEVREIVPHGGIGVGISQQRSRSDELRRSNLTASMMRVMKKEAKKIALPIARAINWLDMFIIVAIKPGNDDLQI